MVCQFASWCELLCYADEQSSTLVVELTLDTVVELALNDSNSRKAQLTKYNRARAAAKATPGT